jgi:hypothetical protein
MSAEEEDGKRGRLGKKGGKRGQRSKPQVLSWDQKLEIARGELEEVKKDAVDTEKNAVRMIDTLKVCGCMHTRADTGPSWWWCSVGVRRP